MFGRAGSGVVLAGSLLAGAVLTGCSSTTGPDAQPLPLPRTGGAPAPGAGSAPPAATACASPKPTESWLGGSTEGLPADVRCLPHVGDGELLTMPPADDQNPSRARNMTVHVTDGTTGDDALALCHRLTELGYGTGGSRGISVLSVGGGEAGEYASMPNQPACLRLH